LPTSGSPTINGGLLGSATSAERTSVRSWRRLIVTVNSFGPGSPVLPASSACSTARAPAEVTSERVLTYRGVNSVALAFFSGLQRELLDQHHWGHPRGPRPGVFDWLEAWYNPHRRHTYNHGYSPADYETLNTPATQA
jgi:hypothetical protein